MIFSFSHCGSRVLTRDNLTVRVNGVLRDRLEFMKKRPFVNSRAELEPSKSFGPPDGNDSAEFGAS